MNAVSLYLSTCRYIMQASPENPYSWGDLYKYLPYLRQALSCCVCTHILHIPMGPIDTICQHHVCKQCIGGKMRLHPSCSWCKDYGQFQENTQLRIVIQCYKKLCQYLSNMVISNVHAEVDNGDKSTVISIIQEGIAIIDDYDYGANPLPLSSFYTKCQSPRRYIEFDNEADKHSAGRELSSNPASPSSDYSSPAASPSLSGKTIKRERKYSRSCHGGGTASSWKMDNKIDSPPQSEQVTAVTERSDDDKIQHEDSVIPDSGCNLTVNCDSVDTRSDRTRHHSQTGVAGRSRRDSSIDHHKGFETNKWHTGAVSPRHRDTGLDSSGIMSRRSRRDSSLDKNKNESLIDSDNASVSKPGHSKRRDSKAAEIRHRQSVDAELILDQSKASEEKDTVSERRDQRSRRTSTTRVAIGDCNRNLDYTSLKRDHNKVEKAEPDTSQAIPDPKPPPLSPRVCLGEHDYMKDSPYYSVSMPNGNEPKLTIRRKHVSSSPGSSPRKRLRGEDQVDFSSMYSPDINLSPFGSSRGKKRKSKLEAKKKGCRCGTAASTPGKLTCCGQRCPCYSTHKPCLDCSCRGCHNPRKLAIPDSTVKTEDDTEDTEIFVV